MFILRRKQKLFRIEHFIWFHKIYLTAYLLNGIEFSQLIDHHHLRMFTVIILRQENFPISKFQHSAVAEIMEILLTVTS